MNTGKIIPVAFPDTFVRYSEEKVLKYFFPLVGLGRKKFIKAGHAILLLIENATGEIQYFDFGRYITPLGMGRVRSALTDAELQLPFKAKISSESSVINIEEILLWLDANPQKTHGNGRLIASVCHHVNFEKANKFLKNLQSQGSIPYLTFGNIGSNCSRLVADTLINACTNPKILKPLKRNSLFTPSPLGNVIHGAQGGKIFKVLDGKVTEYEDSVLKENLTNYFDPKIPKVEKKELQPKIGNAQLLKGIGASAYFELIENDKNYIIKRYNENFEQDFKGEFLINKSSFNIEKPYQFVYDCNCNYCHVEQNGEIFRFDVILKRN